LAGDLRRLKAYTLGVEVFDRGAGFDPGTDPIVRVDAGRLRSKLLAHYSGEGARDPVLVDVPKGGYAAQFVFRKADASRSGWPAPHDITESPRQRPRIAVLPFANLSDDAEQEYFADGMTEDLLTDLSKLSGLFVVSRHSVFAYKGANWRIEEIAGELGVRYVLEGSVRRSGDTLRITAQLVDAQRGDHLWAERYDRPLRDLFAVQDDVTRHIVRALTVQLSPLEDARIGPESTASLEAHDCVQRGVALFWSYTPQALSAPQALFAQAVTLDPEYPAAHARLALAAINRHSAVFDRTGASLGQACEHARTAVLLDAMLPLAQAATCCVQQWAGQAEDSLEAGRRSVALDPNYADGHAILSLAPSANDQAHEALRHIEIGMRLNPRPTGYFHMVKGLALALLHRTDEAMETYREGLAAWPVYRWNLIYLAHCCLRNGRAAEAHQLLDQFRAVEPTRELVGCRAVCGDGPHAGGPSMVLGQPSASDARDRDGRVRLSGTRSAIQETMQEPT
jgi:adenylate cyclase